MQIKMDIRPLSHIFMGQCGRQIRLFTLLKVETDSIAKRSVLNVAGTPCDCARPKIKLLSPKSSFALSYILVVWIRCLTWNWCLWMEREPKFSWIHFTFYLDSCNFEFELHPQICVNGSKCTNVNGIIRFSKNKRNSFHSNPKWITVHGRSWQTFTYILVPRKTEGGEKDLELLQTNADSQHNLLLEQRTTENSFSI